MRKSVIGASNQVDWNQPAMVNTHGSFGIYIYFLEVLYYAAELCLCFRAGKCRFSHDEAHLYIGSEQQFTKLLICAFMIMLKAGLLV